MDKITYKSQFCSKCESIMDIWTVNRYDLAPWNNGDSVFRCRSCKHCISLGETSRVVMLVRNYGDSSGDKFDDGDRYMPRLSITDPTLPRIKIVCPQCTNTKPSDAAFVKISAYELLFRYTCCKSGHTWTNKISK